MKVKSTLVKITGKTFRLTNLLVFIWMFCIYQSSNIYYLLFK